MVRTNKIAAAIGGLAFALLILPATYAVTSSMRRVGARALWTRVTLETDTPAADAIWARMEDSCVVKAEGERLKRRTSCTSRPYLHLYPATHLQCTSRLD